MNLLSALALLAGDANHEDTNRAAALLPALLKQVRKYPGGLNGLVAAFQQNGLGEIVASWISTGPNLPVTVEQLQGVLGAFMIEQLAQDSGQESSEVLELLARFMPMAIDRLTPDGELPEDGGLSAASLLGLLAALRSAS